MLLIIRERERGREREGRERGEREGGERGGGRQTDSTKNKL